MLGRLGGASWVGDPERHDRGSPARRAGGPRGPNIRTGKVSADEPNKCLPRPATDATHGSCPSGSGTQSFASLSAEIRRRGHPPGSAARASPTGSAGSTAASTMQIELGVQGARFQYHVSGRLAIKMDSTEFVAGKRRGTSLPSGHARLGRHRLVRGQLRKALTVPAGRAQDNFAVPEPIPEILRLLEVRADRGPRFLEDFA